MRLLTITYYKDNEIIGYIELEEAYAEFRLTKEGMSEYLNIYPKIGAPGSWGQTLRFRDYEHFVGVCSKFSPYTSFLKKPVEIESLDFDLLLGMCE